MQFYAWNGAWNNLEIRKVVRHTHTCRLHVKRIVAGKKFFLKTASDSFGFSAFERPKSDFLLSSSWCPQ